MGPLAAVERFLERLFERQSARLFRTAIRPVQVQRRLERSMEEARTRDGIRTVVPHRFSVRLHPADLVALRAAAPQLAATLADAALAFARSHSYTLLDRPVVAILGDPSVPAGDIAVDPAIAVDPSAAHDDAREDHAVDQGDLDGARAARATAEEEGSESPAGAGGAGHAPVADHTAVFVVPGIEGPRATIREIRPDQSSRTIAFDGRPLTIGRAADNGVVLRDGRASRHHARIDGRRGSLVLSDLGSTNGSFVNDRRIDSIALGEGDRIRVGTTTLLIETIGPPSVTGATGARPSEPAAGGAADGSIAG